MRASAIEFRLRMVIMIAIVFVGFWAPWLASWDLQHRVSLLEWLALQLSRTGLASFAYATPAIIVCGALLAGLGAVLRVWGTAYLGYGTVHHGEMQAGAMMADGPYRFLRNPLYVGGWCMMAAIALLMPPTGALFTMAFITVFYLRLILGEEAFLATKIGAPYQEYLHLVPRLVPRLRANLPPGGRESHWFTAVLTEVNPIGVFVTLAFLSWSYDNELMIKAILVSFGLSLVARALAMGRLSKPDPA